MIRHKLPLVCTRIRPARRDIPLWHFTRNGRAAAIGWRNLALALALATAAAFPGRIAQARIDGSIESLLENSPFGSQGQADGNREAGLEFRGFVYDDLDPEFCIYDAALKKSFWIGRNEAVDQVEVRRFERGTGELVVAWRGKTVTLHLKQAAIALLPHNPASRVAGATVPEGTVSGAEPSADADAARAAEAARVEQNRAEINRRRAALRARQQVLGATPSPG